VSGTLEVGQVLTVRRRITAHTIAAFGELTGDLAAHHLVPSSGRLAVHGGYLGAMIPLLGGREYIVRQVSLEFLAPAHPGDELTAATVISSSRSVGHLGTVVTGDVTIINQHGTTLVRGSLTGLIPPHT
jgi:acyl dehydratase